MAVFQDDLWFLGLDHSLHITAFAEVWNGMLTDPATLPLQALTSTLLPTVPQLTTAAGRMFADFYDATTQSLMRNVASESGTWSDWYPAIPNFPAPAPRGLAIVSTYPQVGSNQYYATHIFVSDAQTGTIRRFWG